MKRTMLSLKHILCTCKSLKLQFILAVTILFASHPAFPYSLNESLVSAYETNPQLKSAVQSLQAVDEDMPTAIAEMLPNTSISVQRGKKNSSNASKETAWLTNSRSISIEQPIFQGGHTIASMKKAKNSIMAERERLKITEQEVLFSAVLAYMNLVRDIEFLELANKNKAVILYHLEATKSRFELGEVTRTDVSQAKASLAEANTNVINAKNAVESSKATYKRIIGKAPLDIKMPKNTVIINSDIEELTKITITSNPFVKSAEYGVKVAKSDINIQKSVLLPTVSIFANKDRQSGNFTNGGINGREVDSDIIGVNISIPLFKGGSEYSQVRRAKHLAGKSSMDLISAQDEATEAVIKAYNDLKNAQSLIKSNQASVESLIVALEGTNQESIAGLRTTLDVLNAEQALFDAQSLLVKSRCNEIISSYNLLAQLGKLTAKDLGLKVSLYKPEENAKKVKYQFVGF